MNIFAMLRIQVQKIYFYFTVITNKLLFFARNTGIHGLRFIVKQNIHTLWRLFWTLVLTLCCVFLYMLLMPVLVGESEVSYTPDTRYLVWTTTFPAVTVCETYNSRAVQKKLLKEYPEFMESLNFDYRRYLSDVLFGRGVCSKTLCEDCGGRVPCDVPWREVINKIHKPCSDLISECKYNNESFECCKKFYEVDSEYGPCYSVNTLQSKYLVTNLLTVNRSTGPGVLSFRLLADAQISVHSPEEQSTNHLDTKLKFGVQTYSENQVDFLFSVVEIENDPLLKFEEIIVRKCRYLHEIPYKTFHTYPVYSYGACKLADDTELSFRQCGCVHPVRDLSHINLYCNYTGINCFGTYEAHKTKLSIEPHNASDQCLPSCVESELTTIHISRNWVHEGSGKGTTVTIRMATLPTLRYQRNLLRTQLDLVVTIGGLVGLFFSASILSVVEIFYLIFRK